MGTSKAYSAPTGGNWPSLKSLVTAFGNEGSSELPPDPPDPLEIGNPEPRIEPAPPPPPIQLPRLSLESLLSRYISAHSGQGGGGAGGAGGTGRGGSTGFGRRVTRTGRNLGGFAQRVSQVGLAQALREFDLAEVVGRPAGEVLATLIDRLCGPGSTMDGALARKAMNKLRAELLADTKTFEDVEHRLSEVVESLRVGGLLMEFYGHYLYEKFSRDFYERLLKSVGPDTARRSMEQIRRTIFAAIRRWVGNRDVGNINWRGEEGQRMASKVLNQTLAIFTVEP